MGNKAARLVLSLIAFGVSLGAFGQDPKPKWYSNPIGRACAELLAPLEDPLRDKTPWATTDATEAAIQAVWASPDLNFSLDQRLEELHRLLLEDRMSQTNGVARSFTRSALKNAKTQKSIYSRTLGRLIGRIGGPHYNPVFNRTQHLPTAPALGKSTDIVDLTVSIHELEHAYHRNSEPIMSFLSMKFLLLEYKFIVTPTPVSPLFRFHEESRALGAQWELVSRIPEPVRRLLIGDLKLRLAAIQFFSTYNLNTPTGREALETQQAAVLDQLKLELGDKAIEAYAILRGHAEATIRWTETHKHGPEMLKMLIQISLDSLENAGLEKPEFLVKQAETHNYTLKKLIQAHYKFGAVRKYMFFVGSLAALTWYMQDTPGLMQTGIYDLDLLFQMIAALAR